MRSTVLIIPAIVAIAVLFCCATKRYTEEAMSITADMNLDRKIGQMIMVAVPGSSLEAGADAILSRYLPGGVILFGYNLSDSDRNSGFIAEMQAASLRYSGIPLFVSIDQEGGRVVRIVSGVTQFPGNMAAGVCGDEKLAYRWGRILGLQLRMTGINMNLAPVLDVNNNPRNPVINTRSIGSDPRLVADLCVRYVRGLQESGCVAIGKHFPGHGDTDRDSHKTLPVIRYGMDRLSRVELVPFRKAVSAGVEGIMTAHIAYPNILGTDEPATISKMFLSDILRKEFDFRGLVITDDMEMHAISRRQEMGEAAVRSILAGADIVLISSFGNNIPVIFDAIKKAVMDGRITGDRLKDSVTRILETKIRYGIMSPDKGRVSPATFVPNEKERKILEDASRVNAELSRRGILYRGRKELLHPAAGTVRVFITKSSILRERLAAEKSNIILADFEEFAGRESGANTVLYLHIVEPDTEYVRRVSEYCRGRSIGLVVVSSGNPFPVTVSGMAENFLLSFSNTEESVRQLGLCLNRAFAPCTRTTLLLGEMKRGE
ncbi:MAG: glycoside hydrolase family 3 protein [Spirochaetes bacterium]|nr:glycoside hydrolase family 3 protein [Spirochaetota bacterium]